MKINPYHSIPNVPNRKSFEKNGQQQGEMKAKTDKVEISSEAISLQKGTKFERERIEKVEALKKQMANGEYKVDPKAVAAKFYDFWNK